MKKKVLILAGYYLPSFKGGGPIQSIKNLVNNLFDKVDFYIVASDRDLKDDEPFKNIITDKWLQVGKAKVFYTNPLRLSWQKTADIINSVDYDVMYLNSFFSFKFSTVPILLNKFKKIKKKPIVIAPRGQFSPGALSLKSQKKKIYMYLSKTVGLYKDIKWHATAETEKKEIKAIFGCKANIMVANNLTDNYENIIYNKKITKNRGELKIVFISRVHPKKNLKKAIEFLKDINGEVEFNIFGLLEDSDYWVECNKIIKELNQNIKVSYIGVSNHTEIIEIFNNHHVFLFPTLGENFGHVISEALIGGCPLIISDQTPWRELEKDQVGWDISLLNNNRFTEVLQHCIDMNQVQYDMLAKNAFNYGKQKSNRKEDTIAAYNLFN